MSQVSVTIGGRPYRLACNAGEERRLERLAKQADDRIGQMRAAFGEVGDHRLLVMALLTCADELAEAQDTAAAERAAAQAELEASESRAQAEAQERDSLAAELDALARRIEALTAALAG